MARSRVDVPEYLLEIGRNIKEERKAKGYKSQEKFAEALEEYRKVHFPAFKPFNKNDVENIENGGKAITVEHILSVCNVLGVSCNRILYGNDPEDQNIVDDLHLSQKTLDCLRVDYKGVFRALRSELTGESWAEIVNFFFDNYLEGVLYDLRNYFVRDIPYEMAVDEYIKDGKQGTLQLTAQDWENVFDYKLSVEIRNARKEYQTNANKKQKKGKKNEQES